MRIGLFVIVAVLCWGFYSVYGIFTRTAKAAPTAVSVVASGTSASVAASAPAAGRADYQIVTENFRAGDDTTYMRTDKGAYNLHEMCPKGLVVGLWRKVVKIETPERRFLFVVGDTSAPPPPPVSVPAPVAASPAPLLAAAPIKTGRDAYDDRMMRAQGGMPATDAELDKVRRMAAGTPTIADNDEIGSWIHHPTTVKHSKRD